MIFQNFVRAFLKAAGHRYIKRIPYMTPRGRRYRYIYRVSSTHQGRHAFDAEHLVEGTKFALHGEGESEFHGHITKVDGDQVTYVIDDGPRKGEEVTTSRQRLVDELNLVHGVQDKLTAERAKVKAAIAEAKRAGHGGVVRRLERRLRALGGEPEAQPAEPTERVEPTENVEPEAEFERVERIDERFPERSELILEYGSATGEDLGDFDSFVRAVQHTYRDPSTAVRAQIDSYIRAVKMYNDSFLEGGEYADAPDALKLKTIKRVKEAYADYMDAWARAQGGAVSWTVTGRDGVSRKEGERRERALRSTEKRQQGATMTMDRVSASIKRELTPYSKAHARRFETLLAYTQLREHAEEANAIKKDKSLTKQQRVEAIARRYNEIMGYDLDRKTPKQVIERATQRGAFMNKEDLRILNSQHRTAEGRIRANDDIDLSHITSSEGLKAYDERRKARDAQRLAEEAESAEPEASSAEPEASSAEPEASSAEPEAQPTEPEPEAQPAEPTEREAENVGADVSSEVSAVRDAIAGALNASERVTRGEMLKESELQFGRPRAEYTLANRLRDLIDALPDGDDELSALRTEYIRSARKRTADAKAVFEKIEARLAQINATDESSEAKDTRIAELRSEFERKLSIREPDPSLYVKLFDEAGYMETLRDVPLNELLDHPYVKEFFDLADTVNDRVDMYTAIPDLPAEFANRLFEAFAQRYKERGKDDLGLSSPVLQGIIYGQNYHSEQGKEERARKEEARKRKYTEPEAQSFDVLGISSSDLDTSDVVGSYRNISHDREARGYDELREWIDTLQGIEEQAQSAIDSGADETRTREQFSQYAKKLLDAKRKVISARAQTASSAITGAGSFNKRQQEKRRQRLDSLEAAYRRLLNQTPEAPTTEGAESPIQTKVKHLINVLNAGDEVDEITSTGRRSRSSSNVDKKLIGFVKQILAEEFEGMESPAFTPVGDRTPLQTAYAKLKGSLNKLEGEQRLRRGSRQSAEDLHDARRVSRARLREALNDLRQAKQEL